MNTHIFGVLILALWLALPIAPGLCSEVLDKPATLHEEALLRYRAGQYEEAAQRYRQLAMLQSNSPDVLRDLMWVLWRAGRFQETAEVALQVASLVPEDLEALGLFARAQVASGNHDKTLEACRQLLALSSGDSQAQLAVAQLYIDMKAYEDAETLLREISDASPEALEVYPKLAMVQFLQRSFFEAANTWTKAVAAFPHRVNYKFHQAQALYYAGQHAAALAIFHGLLAEPSARRRALVFLVDDAIATGKLSVAAELLERNLSTPQIEDEPRLLTLAKIYLELRRPEKSIATLDRCLVLNPKDGEALLFKASCLRERDKSNETIRLYKQILQLNPWCLNALAALAGIYGDRGQSHRAAEVLAQARKLDPTDPYLLLRYAQELYEAGDAVASRELLIGWLKTNSEPVLPVLLYRGLTPFRRDPLLADPIHLTTEVFEDQMRALSEAGFTPVTAEQVNAWYHGGETLPNRPVLISFDDARVDSFLYADSILERYGLKATMFVAIGDVERNLPRYTSWRQLEDYQKTGRWEIQAHGDLAHDHIPIDGEGHTGLFLVNQQWLKDEQRLETREEWLGRIAADHERAKQKIAQHLETSPVAFAYPEGNFGQEGIPSAPEAAQANLELARKAFGTSYRQDRYGLNVRSRDPMLLTRVAPKPTWTGQDLIRHITDQNPLTQMRLRLLRWAIWEGRPREAHYWLNELRSGGASEALVLSEEARIRFYEGNVASGRRLIRRALELNSSPETMRIAEALEARQRPVLVPHLQFQTESQDRESWAFQHYLDFSLGHARGKVGYIYAAFREQGTGHIVDNGVSLGMTSHLGLSHRAAIETASHFMSGEAHDTVSVSGRLESRWTDTLTTRFEAGRSPVQTARALLANVREQYLAFLIEWAQWGSWRALARGRAVDYSDHNLRYTTTVEVARRLAHAQGLEAVYSFTFDDAQEHSPNYYSPSRLQLHQLGVGYALRLGKGFEVDLRYLPGYGDEVGANPRFVHVLEARFPVKWRGRTVLTPSLSWTKTPTYRRNTYHLVLEYRF